MIQIAGGFQFRDLYIYPEQGEHASPDQFFYFPVTPQPETDSQGRPTLLSIPTGQGGFLQLGTHLGAGQDEGELIEEARRELVGRLNEPASPVETSGALPVPPMHGVGDPLNILLEPAPMKVRQARLQLGKGEEDPSAAEVLAQSDTSGFHPFTALFNAQLNAEQQARVVAALNGRPGFLQVIYDASLSLPVQASARFLGDIRGMIAELAAIPGRKPVTAPDVTDPAGSSGADLYHLADELLQKAVEQGQVKVETQSSDSAPQSLQQHAIDEARQRMLNLLVHEARRRAQTPPVQVLAGSVDQAHAEAAASFTDSVEYPLSLVTDVATWFGGQRKGTDHLMFLPGK